MPPKDSDQKKALPSPCAAPPRINPLYSLPTQPPVPHTSKRASMHGTHPVCTHRYASAFLLVPALSPPSVRCYSHTPSDNVPHPRMTVYAFFALAVKIIVQAAMHPKLECQGAARIHSSGQSCNGEGHGDGVGGAAEGARMQCLKEYIYIRKSQAAQGINGACCCQGGLVPGSICSHPNVGQFNMWYTFTRGPTYSVG